MASAGWPHLLCMWGVPSGFHSRVRFVSLPTKLPPTDVTGTGHPTYLSYMTHQLLCNHNEKYVGKMKTKPVFCEADHGDDLAFTFGVPFASEASSDDFRFSDEERELSRKWMTFIARFAATGYVINL